MSALIHFVNGPRKGGSEVVERPGEPYYVDFANPPPLIAYRDTGPIDFGDMITVTRYVYLPFLKHVGRLGIENWYYSLEERSSAVAQPPKKREYKIIRRPKFNEKRA